MKKEVILILGSGHLSSRLKKILSKKDYEIIHNTVDSINTGTESGSLLENLVLYMKSIDIDAVVMIFLLDEKDEVNLELILAIISIHSTIPITAALFNENLIPHLLKVANNLTILNPAKIAAPVFVDAIYLPLKRVADEKTLIGLNEFKTSYKDDLLIKRLLLSFTAIIGVAVGFFHFFENLSWINSLYFVIVTVATVGYGDVNLINSAALSKIFVILLILISTFFIWMIFSLTIDRVLKTRIQLALGRKKYNISNHIIVCGLGRLGYFVVEELLRKKEKVIVIEENENSRHIDYFRQSGAEVYIGDGRLSKVLDDVNITRARALISVINSDALNLEIGLNARAYNPDIRLILRIFDDQMGEKIKEYLNIHLTLSASAIADAKFYEVLKDKAG